MELEFSTDLDAKGLDFGESFAMSTGDLPSVIAGENRYEEHCIIFSSHHFYGCGETLESS